MEEEILRGKEERIEGQSSRVEDVLERRSSPKWVKTDDFRELLAKSRA